METIRDRIKDFRRVRANEILPNPANWRTHPPEQVNALKGVLAEVGFADAVAVFETPAGLMLVDGHARIDVAGDGFIPVIVLDITEGEADLLLATIDPVKGMAIGDRSKMDVLIKSASPKNPAVKSMLAAAREKAVELKSQPLPTIPSPSPAPGQPAPASPASNKASKDPDIAYLFFRQWQIPMPDEVARELEEKIKAFCEETGTTHGATGLLARGL